MHTLMVPIYIEALAVLTGDLIIHAFVFGFLKSIVLNVHTFLSDVSPNTRICIHLFKSLDSLKRLVFDSSQKDECTNSIFKRSKIAFTDKKEKAPDANGTA